MMAYQGYAYTVGGRWWTYFAVLSVTLNDASAYFAGKGFGKHHLIRLSPNKTIEGFVGALISNIVVTYIMAVYFMNSDFWRCAPKRFNYGFFEDFVCDTNRPPYLEKDF